MLSESKRGNRMAASSAALCPSLIAFALVGCLGNGSAAVAPLRVESASPAPEIVLVLHVRDAPAPVHRLAQSARHRTQERVSPSDWVHGQRRCAPC